MRDVPTELRAAVRAPNHLDTIDNKTKTLNHQPRCAEVAGTRRSTRSSFSVRSRFSRAMSANASCSSSTGPEMYEILSGCFLFLHANALSVSIHTHTQTNTHTHTHTQTHTHAYTHADTHNKCLQWTAHVRTHAAGPARRDCIVKMINCLTLCSDFGNRHPGVLRRDDINLFVCICPSICVHLSRACTHTHAQTGNGSV